MISIGEEVVASGYLRTAVEKIQKAISHFKNCNAPAAGIKVASAGLAMIGNKLDDMDFEKHISLFVRLNDVA